MNKLDKINRRKIRTRKKIRGTKEMPRLTVFRSNRGIYAQLINDETGKTIVGISEKDLESGKENKKKIDIAHDLGLALAKKILEKKISKIVFDKGSYAYHGRVKSLAEGAREGGLKF